MSDKKRIDRIFQENFKYFEVSPDEKVWKNIEAELKKEKKRKVIPIPVFWYKAAGVAALVAISFLIGNIINNSPQTEVVNSKNVIEDPSKIQSAEKTFTKKNQLDSPSGQGIANSSEEKESTNSTQGFTPDKNSQQYSTTNSTLKANSSNVGKTAITYNSYPENPGAKSQGNSSTDDFSDRNDQKKKIKEKNPRVIAYQEKSTDKYYTGKKDEVSLSLNSSETIIATENTAVLFPSKVIDKETSEENTEGLLAETLEPEEEEKKKSLVEAAEELKEEEEEDRDDHEGELPKWLIRPNVSPIYYGSLNGGNTIDPQFANNSAKGEVTMAYGVNFAYSISKKIKIRSGVSKVNMSYNTNDIVFSSSIDAVALTGIDNHPQADNIEVQSRPSSTTEPSSSEVQENLLTPVSSGILNQHLGFIEVPMEIEYALLDTRFGIHIIGGASTLFLDENTVSINSVQGTTDLGEANNLNNVSFSTNVGLGFGYELTKKVDLNLEPTFKYQFNTFSNNTNGFKPYYFGVYTGFSFKF